MLPYHWWPDHCIQTKSASISWGVPSDWWICNIAHRLTKLQNTEGCVWSHCAIHGTCHKELYDIHELAAWVIHSLSAESSKDIRGIVKGYLQICWRASAQSELSKVSADLRRMVTAEPSYCIPILDKLLPGDVVLAEWGFDASDSVGMMWIVLLEMSSKSTPFCKAHCRFSLSWKEQRWKQPKIRKWMKLGPCGLCKNVQKVLLYLDQF